MERKAQKSRPRTWSGGVSAADARRGGPGAGDHRRPPRAELGCPLRLGPLPRRGHLPLARAVRRKPRRGALGIRWSTVLYRCTAARSRPERSYCNGEWRPADGHGGRVGSASEATEGKRSVLTPQFPLLTSLIAQRPAMVRWIRLVAYCSDPSLAFPSFRSSRTAIRLSFPNYS